MNKSTKYILISIIILIFVLVIIFMKIGFKSNFVQNQDISNSDFKDQHVDNRSNSSNDESVVEGKIKIQIQQKDGCFTVRVIDNVSNIGGFSLKLPKQIRDLSVKDSTQTKLVKTSSGVEGLILNQNIPYNLGEICVNSQVDVRELFNTDTLTMYEINTGKPLDVEILY